MKLIKTKDKFILVTDEEIKEGDYKYHHVTGIRKALVDGNYTNQKKIIAGIPELPSIDFSLLSEEDCKTIGWIDVERLAEDNWTEDKYNEELFENQKGSYCAGFWEGFKKAQSINDKRFSLEDMRKAWSNGNNYHKGTLNQASEFTFDNTIQSLQQTSWNVEVEMEQPDGADYHSGYIMSSLYKGKQYLPNPKIKITKLVKDE